MTRDMIKQELNKIYISIFPERKQAQVSLPDEATEISCLGINSLNMLYMLLQIEEQFNIKFNMEAIVNIKTIAEMVDYIENNIVH